MIWMPPADWLTADDDPPPMPPLPPPDPPAPAPPLDPPAPRPGNEIRAGVARSGSEIRAGIFGVVRALLPLCLLLSGCDSGWHYRWEIGGGRFRAQATSITPITSLGAASSGITAPGDRYDVTCSISGGTATLYPAVYESAWTIYPGQSCTLDSSTAGKGTCEFRAYRESGGTWNAYKTGAGTISSCTATPRTNLVALRTGGGTVSLADLSPSPAGTYATPSSVTVNAKGLVTALTAGSGGGPTLYTTNLGDNGDTQVLGGTNISSGRVVGYCKHITTASGDTTNVSLLSVVFNEDEGAGSVVDTTGDTTGASITYGTGAVDITSAPLVLGFTRVCKHWVIPAS